MSARPFLLGLGLLFGCDDALIGKLADDAGAPALDAMVPTLDAGTPDAGIDASVACNLGLLEGDAGLLPTLAYGGAGPSATGQIPAGQRVTGGRQFEVTEDCVVITDLAVWDHFSDGLSRDHAVVLFSIGSTGSDVEATLVPGGQAVAGRGDDVPLEREFRIAPLAAPILLERGFYAVIAYDFSSEEPFGLGGSVPDGATGVRDVGYGPVETSTEPSPYYPRSGDESARATASFRYVIAR
jgi:hypothetical protein